MSGNRRGRWLGIDFSGNDRMWTGGCEKSNVWIAFVKRDNQLTLSDLRTVQELPGPGRPFLKLTALLKNREVNAAGIDAPFSLPTEYVPLGGHRRLLEAISTMERPDGRWFPSARHFTSRMIGERLPELRKPLRETERYWSHRVNVRSTLWAGPRGGAAMTSVCLTLLHEAQCPIWPWDGPRTAGLLVEAFPAAQLRHWSLPWQGYSGNARTAILNRRMILDFLSEHISIPRPEKRTMLGSADALDAVICAFAAIAVTADTVFKPPQPSPLEEGLIAIHERAFGVTRPHNNQQIATVSSVPTL